MRRITTAETKRAAYSDMRTMEEMRIFLASSLLGGTTGFMRRPGESATGKVRLALGGRRRGGGRGKSMFHKSISGREASWP
jgi:hypothetical protein